MLYGVVAVGAVACAGVGSEARSPGAVPGGGGARLRLVERAGEGDAATVVVEGLSFEARTALATLSRDDPALAGLLDVYTGEGPPHPDQPPLLGRTRLEGGRLHFRPRFPLMPGLPHFARFRGSLVGVEDVELVFALERPDLAPRARVVAVEPQAELVPANLLRVYVHFSEPMRARGVLEHLHLYDVAGNEVVEPFLDVEDGLWDPDRMRLTVFFHPGRIKRGVGPNAVLGPPLEPGGRYELVIDDELEDAAGTRLVAPYTWSFRTGPRDEESPDPHTWTVEAPEGPEGSLEIDFGEPLDSSLAGRLVLVETDWGERLEGEVGISDGGRRWTWRPAEPWRSGDYAVVVHPALEDLAGNAVGHRFEELLSGENVTEAGAPAPVHLPFAVELP